MLETVWDVCARRNGLDNGSSHKFVERRLSEANPLVEAFANEPFGDFELFNCVIVWTELSDDSDDGRS